MTDDDRWLANLIGPCPECGNGKLAVVTDSGGSRNLLCSACGSCWHTEFEWSRRVDPRACSGCPAQTVCGGPGGPLARCPSQPDEFIDAL